MKDFQRNFLMIIVFILAFRFATGRAVPQPGLQPPIVIPI
ncbi:hypothetical protein CACET_c37270 [Clostridium aceticum]|uniref:Uncharacterized protein n=1 Tax=Clostridium aceticum TaxID=84022 RepID=A0A0G3WGZ9_9CLOT|nr:hypothetical protein CACET_c37270 [Clostridium aceticum]